MMMRISLSIAMLLCVVMGCDEGEPAQPPVVFAPPSSQPSVPAGTSEADAEAVTQDNLIGQPAPAAVLDLLDGGKMDLAKHKGKEIVILDFWATWCAPCIATMPDLIKVTNEYRDRGVVFYAVNLEEDPETISRFLAKKGLEVTVALDRDAAVAKAYGVIGVPRRVLIDRSGTVVAVHDGPDLKIQERVSEELDALLAKEKSN
jgi:thiol-disulfide isomerase/thioredoxin